LPAGLWLAVRIGRPRFVGLGFYVIAAVLVLDAVLILRRPSTEVVAETVLDARVPTILLLASAGVLAIQDKGITFYLGVTATLLAVLFRSILHDEFGSTGMADLGLICGTSILLLASRVFTVAYYVNTPDTVNHTSTAIVLRDAGFLSAISETRYFLFSAYHILASTGMQFTQLNPRLSIAVFMIALFQIAILALFLFFRNWGQTNSLALIGTLLVSINIAFLNYGARSHYQSMSFVLFAIFLFLLSRSQWTARDVVITALVITTWVTTHHVTLLMAISLLVAPIGYLAVRVWRQGAESSERMTVFTFATFCLIFGVYWTIITTKFREILIWVFFTSGSAEGIPSRIYIIQSYESVGRLLRESIPFFVDSLHYSFLLAIACLGIYETLTTERLGHLRWRLVSLGFVPAAALYFPNPIWVLLEGTIPFSRWRLMVLPLLILFPAAGLKYGTLRTNSTVIRRVGIVLITAALVFTTVTSGMSNPGLTDLAGIEKGSQEHLTEEELQATEFTYAYMDGQQVYSRSILQVYLHQYAWAENKPYNEEQFDKIRVSQEKRRFVTEPGLTIVSVGAFTDKGIKALFVDTTSAEYPDGEIYQAVHPSTYRWDRERTSVVYTNGEVVIQHQRKPPG
jgi:hypothetical protein